MKLKQIERVWKAFALRSTCLLMRATGRPGPVPDWQGGPTRVLFLRQDRIGDAIVSSGLLRAIDRVSPELTIEALASPRNAEILRRDPSVAAVHVFDKRQPGTFAELTRKLRDRRYDAVIDCMVTAPSMTGLMLMVASGARHRIGIAERGVDAALTIPVQPTTDSAHIIDLLAALGEPFGIDREATDWRPTLALTGDERAAAEARWGGAGRGGRKRLLVNVSAGHPDRYWPADRFVESILQMKRKVAELDVAVIGDPGERERVERIAEVAGARAVETPGLVEAIGIVATADLLLTPDTSVAHMAAAFRIPAVVMYRTPEAAAQWGLYASPGVAVAAGGSLSTLPLERVLPELERLAAAV